MKLFTPVAGRSSTSLDALRIVGSIAGGSLLLALAANAKVPFWPVPLTLQTLAVLALGAALGPVLAGAAVLAYLAEGVLGLPVFAGGIGPATLLGPTGGYLVGSVPAAIVAGLVAQRGWRSRPLKAAATFLAADAVIFIGGVAWLASMFGWEKAVAAGLTPFLLGEAVKIALATAGSLALARRA